MRCKGIIGGAAFLFLAALGAPAVADEAPAQAQSVIEVQLPAEAELTIDGEKTTSTGDDRRFVPPPLIAGHTYVYALKATWKGKVVDHKLEFKPDALVKVDLRPEFDATKPATPDTAQTPSGKEGFEKIEKNGRLWVFRAGSKELEEYKKNGDLEKHVTRLNAGPNHETIMAPDAATIDDFLKSSGK